MCRFLGLFFPRGLPNPVSSSSSGPRDKETEKRVNTTRKRMEEIATGLHQGEDISEHTPASATAGACLSRPVGNKRFPKIKSNGARTTKCKRRDDGKIAAKESQVQARSGKWCPSAGGNFRLSHFRRRAKDALSTRQSGSSPSFTLSFRPGGGDLNAHWDHPRRF